MYKPSLPPSLQWASRVSLGPESNCADEFPRRYPAAQPQPLLHSSLIPGQIDVRDMGSLCSSGLAWGPRGAEGGGGRANVWTTHNVAGEGE